MANSLTQKQQETLDRMMIDALRVKDLATLQLCLSKGADPKNKVSIRYGYYNENNDYQMTDVTGSLLHSVCQSFFNEEIVDCLLKVGLSIDEQDSEGNTAFLWAVRCGNAALADYLLGKGADPLVTNKKGKSPLDLAYDLPERTYTDAKKKLKALLLKALPDVTKEFNGAAKEQNNSDAALPHDILAPTPLAKNPPKKDGGAMEF